MLIIPELSTLSSDKVPNIRIVTAKALKSLLSLKEVSSNTAFKSILSKLKEDEDFDVRQSLI